jgi:hypothetical protein
MTRDFERRSQDAGPVGGTRESESRLVGFIQPKRVEQLESAVRKHLGSTKMPESRGFICVQRRERDVLHRVGWIVNVPAERLRNVSPPGPKKLGDKYKCRAQKSF